MLDSREKSVYGQVQRRIAVLSGSSPAIRGQLANLRRAAGRKPGEDPRVWGILFEDFPENLQGKGNEPSRAEWAVYTALTLYAVHRQGKEEGVVKEGVSLGDAANSLVQLYGGNEDARQRVSRRFYQIALAQDMAALSYYLRGFVQLLRAGNIGLDYAKLAQDLYRYQFPDGAAAVRLKWGQDYYRNNKNENEP